MQLINTKLLTNWHNWVIVGSMAFIGAMFYAVIQGHKPGDGNNG